MNVAPLALGTDLVEVDRIAKALDRTAGFANRVFTEAEIAYCTGCANAAERFAARWAAKEAVLKALGVGLGAVEFKDIEIVKEPSGAPSLLLSGSALRAANEAGVTSWLISMTHTTTTAQAVVIGLG